MLTNNKKDICTGRIDYSSIAFLSKKLRVGVIGAGKGGVIKAKHFLKQNSTRNFRKIHKFPQNFLHADGHKLDDKQYRNSTYHPVLLFCMSAEDAEQDVGNAANPDTICNGVRQRHHNQCQECRHCRFHVIQVHFLNISQHKHANVNQRGRGGTRGNDSRHGSEEQAQEEGNPLLFMDVADAVDVGVCIHDVNDGLLVLGLRRGGASTGSAVRAELCPFVDFFSAVSTIHKDPSFFLCWCPNWTHSFYTRLWYIQTMREHP